MRFGWDLMRQFLKAANTWEGNQTFAGQIALSNTVWDDMRMGSFTAKLPTSNYPSWDKIADDGAGSTGIYGYNFSDGDYLFMQTQFSHKYKYGTDIHPHIHFLCDTDVDPSDNFGIGIEYIWHNITDSITTSTIVETTIPTGVNSSYQHQLVELGSTDIDGTGKTLSSLFMCRIYRFAALTDNYAGGVIITDFDIHFEMDAIGSDQEYVK